MADEDSISVEVAYATPDEQVILAVAVPADNTIAQVILRSGILDRFPEIDLAENKVGVFGKLAELSSTLNAGDRVEIYRPLIADPKEARRRRAAEGKAMNKGAGGQGAGADT